MNYRTLENYSYTENIPRSTYELLLTPNGAVRNNPIVDKNSQENSRENLQENSRENSQENSQENSRENLQENSRENSQENSQEKQENFLPPVYTHPQPYSYGFPYAEYKYNEYSYFPKSNMSGVV